MFAQQRLKGWLAPQLANQRGIYSLTASQGGESYFRVCLPSTEERVRTSISDPSQTVSIEVV